MTDIEKQIADAIRQLGLSEQQIRRLPPEAASEVVQKAQQLYITGEPRSWWLSLKVPHTAFDYPDGSGCKHLNEHWLNKTPICWFIPETEKPNLPVYEAEIIILPELLSECGFFEYYLLSKDWLFLLVETDHNQIITAQAPAM
jgi:hypothetical protein